MRWLAVLVPVLLLGGLGCARKGEDTAGAPGASMRVAKEAARAEKKMDAGQEPDTVPRKIIYSATIMLLVENFSKAEKELLQLVQDHKGYISNSEVRGTPGAPRSGRWQARIPVKNFDTFRDAVVKLGDIEKTSIDSQDVTSEYYDLEAQIKNKKVEEERLLEHLKKSTGSLKDILEVERELDRVRGQIERHQGRLKLLTKLTDLTTVTVILNEREGYVPQETPSFGTSVTRTFTSSWKALLDVGKELILFLVALVPWTPVLALVGVPLCFLIRRRFRAQR